MTIGIDHRSRSPVAMRGSVPAHAVGQDASARIARAPRPPLRPQAATSERPAIDRGWALLVEDDRELADLAAQLIAHIGYRVQTCRNGREAMVWFSRNVDIVELAVIDRQLHGLGGCGLFRAIRTLAPRIPVVICSGRLSLDEEVQLAREGIDGVIHKPFDVWDFVEAVETAIRARRAALAARIEPTSEETPPG